MSKNYIRLVIGIVGSFLLLLPSQFNLYTCFALSVIVGYFFGLYNTIYYNTQPKKETHEQSV